MPISSNGNRPVLNQLRLSVQRLHQLWKINSELGLLCLFLPAVEACCGVRMCTSMPLRTNYIRNVELQTSMISCDASGGEEGRAAEFSDPDQVMRATCVHYIHTLCTRCKRYKALPITLPAPVYEGLIRKWSGGRYSVAHSGTHARCCAPACCTSSPERGQAHKAKAHQNVIGKI